MQIFNLFQFTPSLTMASPPRPPTKNSQGKALRSRSTQGKPRQLLANLDEARAQEEPMDCETMPSCSSSNLPREQEQQFPPHGPQSVKKFVDHMIALLRDSDFHPRHAAVLTELKSILNRACTLAPLEEITSITDHAGCNLVQRAVRRNCHEFIEYLLMRGYHMRNLKMSQNHPLYMACRAGHIKIVCLFLDYGADISSYSTSGNASNQGPRLSQNSSSQFNVHVGKCSPLYAAISKDQVEIVKILMTRNPSRRPEIDFKTFQFACSHGAKSSLAFLIQFAPYELSKRDKDGNTLLSYAFGKSDECGRVLLETAAVCWPRDILEDCSGKQETLLHVMYKSCVNENMAELTKLAFSKGLSRECINKQDKNGHTPLHILMKQVGRKLAAAYSSFSPLMSGRRVNMNSPHLVCVDDHMFETVSLLVNEGADLHLKNRVDETVLHHLLQDTFLRRLHGMPSVYYHNILPEINKILGYLLSKGAEVDSHSSIVSTPLMWLARIVCSMQSTEIDACWPEILYSFRSLVQYGADPNVEDEKGISVVSLLLTAVSRWLHQCSPGNDLECAYRILKYVQELLGLFFSHGLCPRVEVLNLCMKQIALLCNIGVHENDFQLGIKNLLLPFVCHGINLNHLEMITDCPENPGIPCPLSAQFYLARGLIIHCDDGGMQTFLTLFEHSLQQDCLNRFIMALCNILVTNFMDDAQQGKGAITNTIHILQGWVHQPRSLKVLCKIRVCCSLAWKLNQSTPFLPLPSALKNFIASF